MINVLGGTSNNNQSSTPSTSSDSVGVVQTNKQPVNQPISNVSQDSAINTPQANPSLEVADLKKNLPTQVSNNGNKGAKINPALKDFGKKKKINPKMVLGILFLVLVIGSLFTIIFFTRKKTYDTRSQASSGSFSTITNTTQLNFLGKNLLLPSPGEDTSQYSPYIVYKKGWGSKIMFYCKNTPIDGVYRDRVWRAEIVNDQIVDNRIAIEGSLNHPTDLSCSPGVVIARDGTWHMYFITADRKTPVDTYIYHAISTSGSGTDWQIIGSINGMFNFPYVMAELPSPILTESGVDLYVVGASNRLMKASSTDFHNFTTAQVVSSAPRFSAGRVVKNHLDNKLYYFYGLTKDAYTPPHEIRLAYSLDGNTFTDAGFLFNNQKGNDWDSDLIQTPFPYFDDSFLRIYYSGVKTAQGAHFSANSGIGYRTFEYKTSNTPTPGETFINLFPEIYWSDHFGDNWIATDPAVKERLIEHGWKKAGDLNWMADRKIAGTAPVYQLWSDYVKDHFYTTSEAQKNEFMGAGWVGGEIIGYLYTSSAQGRVAIYRYDCGPWENEKEHYFLYLKVDTDLSARGCRKNGILGYTIK